MSWRSGDVVEYEASAVGDRGLTVSSGLAGILLGTDHLGVPVVLRPFRPKSTRLLLVERGWVQRILILRALALGARVVIHTPQPQYWAGFGAYAAGQPDRVAAVLSDESLNPSASATQPVLHVIEGPPPADPLALGPWQAELRVVAQIGEDMAQPILAADVLILRRLSQREMTVAATMLRLDPMDSAALRLAPDNGLVILAAGQKRYVRLTATQVEQQMFGSPTVT